jgi:NADH dehydrogenase (ubiquinone) 1 alpha subcomplex subunit 5
MGARASIGNITVGWKRMGHPLPLYGEADPMTSRIGDAETQIGGGLIEEVIEVAEGELKLVNTMLESKVCVLMSSRFYLEF